MVPGDGQIGRCPENFDIPEFSFGQTMRLILHLYKNMNSSTRRGNFGIALAFINDLLGPGFNCSSFGVAAMIKSIPTYWSSRVNKNPMPAQPHFPASQAWKAASKLSHCRGMLGFRNLPVLGETGTFFSRFFSYTSLYALHRRNFLSSEGMFLCFSFFMRPCSYIDIIVYE